MRILLCAATEMEIHPTAGLVRTGKLPIEVFITGVGLPAAMYALTKKLCTQQFDYIVQAGVAGALGEHLHLCQTVVVKSDMVGDTGVTENDRFQSLFDMGFAEKDGHPWHEGKLINPLNDNRHAGMQIVDAVTVNEVTTNAARIDYYKQVLHAGIETMEGAALHYVGIMEGIPFLQIRSISNYVGERDKTKWDLRGAIGTLNDQLQRLLKEFFA